MPKKSAPVRAKKTAAPVSTIELDRARAHWYASSGLAAPFQGSLEALVAATGWVRTLGGVDAYLALRARSAKATRRAVERALETGALQVVPAVRSCMYLVPRRDVPLVLSVAAGLYRPRAEAELRKVGVSARELGALQRAVERVLSKGPLGPDGIRKALPEGAARSLGEAGKKIGMSSPLPTALRYLELEGRIERTLEHGRLDSERYLWRVPAKNPFEGAQVPREGAERAVELARIFLGHAGPASAADFSSWSGLSMKEARAGIAGAGAVSVAVEGYAEEAFVLEERLEALREARVDEGAAALLPFEDNFLVLHGGPAIVTRPEHHGVKVPAWGPSRGETLGEVKHISLRAVVLGGRVAGFWEYDPDGEKIVFGLFERATKEQTRALEPAAEAAVELIRELESAKSVSLDTGESIRERVELVRAVAGAQPKRKSR